jgi:formylglycine-generating enzyme required for sulfatase activity
MEMILIPGGSYSNTKKSKIYVSSFYASKYLITEEDFSDFLIIYNRRKNIKYHKKSKIFGSNYPMTNISWLDATDFCNYLSKKEKLPLSYKNHIPQLPFKDGYRLMTKAEFCYINNNLLPSDIMVGFEWNDNKIHEVGLKTPNIYGLYDSCSNGCHIVNDRVGWSYYNNEVADLINPCGVESGPKKFGLYYNFHTSRLDYVELKLDNTTSYERTIDYRDLTFRIVRSAPEHKITITI